MVVGVTGPIVIVLQPVELELKLAQEAAQTHRKFLSNHTTTKLQPSS